MEVRCKKRNLRARRITHITLFLQMLHWLPSDYCTHWLSNTKPFIPLTLLICMSASLPMLHHVSFVYVSRGFCRCQPANGHNFPPCGMACPRRSGKLLLSLPSANCAKLNYSRFLCTGSTVQNDSQIYLDKMIEIGIYTTMLSYCKENPAM